MDNEITVKEADGVVERFELFEKIYAIRDSDAIHSANIMTFSDDYWSITDGV